MNKTFFSCENNTSIYMTRRINNEYRGNRTLNLMIKKRDFLPLRQTLKIKSSFDIISNCFKIKFCS